MSTRSGKRIHNFFEENVDNVPANNLNCITEKKIRKKRLKENIDMDLADVSEKRHNYVAYPGNDKNDSAAIMELQRKTRKSKKNILKEHDINEANFDVQDTCTVTKKTGRLTRQARKFNEQEIENTESMHVSNKKNKSKNVSQGDLNDMETTNNATNKKLMKKKEVTTISQDNTKVITKKKSKKRKHGKKTSGNLVKNITKKKNKTLNKSVMSEDSFHSAAGSPVGGQDNISSHGELKNCKSTSHDIFLSLDEEKPNNQPVRKTRQQKASIKTGVNMLNTCNSHEETTNITILDKINESVDDKVSSKHKFSINPGQHNEEETANVSQVPKQEVTQEPCNTSKIINRSTRSVSKNRNSNIPYVSEAVEVTNAATEQVEEINYITDNAGSVKKQRCSRQLSHLEPENTPNMTKPNKINNSDKKQQILLDKKFEDTVPKLDSTFDKQIEKVTKNPDSTFDKCEEQSVSKSSLISSDSELNGSLNKTNDISKISITSDESKTENIVNTTPVLVESSLDNTQLEDTPTKGDHVIAVTPLKREGTFTKDGPESSAVESPVTMGSSSNSTTNKTPMKDSLTTTPDKATLLGTPGSTPFPFSKGSQKKSVLNVTRSIEKGSKPLPGAAAPRATRVMFCSPVDFPLPTTESKRRIVKSSVKGSNKSFVFDNSVCSPAPRKRSLTHEAESVRAKRSRLADDLMHSVERLSRPRTSSATGKLGSSTPSSKPATPSRPRTRLPNFAALHQKQFARMESLDECQQRKARRAKQLLVPTGSVALLERTSPKGTDSPRKSKECKMKKPKPEIKQGDSTLPSYTRFGFKMNIPGVGNPFSVPTKLPATAIKPKDKKPIANNTRTTLPSLTGITSVRKDVAKQIIMREKSFTSLSNKRDSKRTQNRTIIKGVRTNRRFELQMQMRNIDG